MAAKHDGPRASANHWVMQQNLARHKAILSYSHKPKAPKPDAVKPPTAADAAFEQAKKSAIENP